MKLSFAECLAREGVSEYVSCEGTFGLMAYHGGALERATDVVAHEVALRTGSSLYAIHHPDDQVHVPSTAIDAGASARLSAFLDHVTVAISLHGYGREGLMRTVLLGGRNRDLAEHVAAELRSVLDPGFDVVSDLAAVPVDLAGQHPRNPVNLPQEAGVQIELPPVLRWNREHHAWCGMPGVPLTPAIEALIAGLSTAIHRWS